MKKYYFSNLKFFEIELFLKDGISNITKMRLLKHMRFHQMWTFVVNFDKPNN